VEMNHKGDTAADGIVKREMNVSKCADEVVMCPIVIQPAITADESAQQSTRRHSARTVKKRSLLLPGEFEHDVNAMISHYSWIVPHPEPAVDGMRDGAENTDDITISVSEVVDVKPEPLPAKKKRTYCQCRKPSTKRNVPADTQNSSESVGRLLGQLVTAYCGDDGHPSNCEECKNRIEMVRALLESSGKCHQDASAGSDTDINFTVPSASEGDSGTEMTQVGLFCCNKCSERFHTFSEWQKHKKIHSDRRKKCGICHRYLAAGTSMAVVSISFIAYTTTVCMQFSVFALY